MTVVQLTAGDVVLDHVPLRLALDADRVHAVFAADVAGVQPVVPLADHLLGLLVELLELRLVGREEVPVVVHLPMFRTWGCTGKGNGAFRSETAIVSCSGHMSYKSIGLPRAVVTVDLKRLARDVPFKSANIRLETLKEIVHLQ